MLLSAVSVLLAALLSGCGGNEPAGPSYGPMFDEVDDWVWSHGYEGGDWDPDWDDAPFWGLAYYARAGWDFDRRDYQGRALEAVDHNLEMAEAGIADPMGALMDNMAGIMFGTLGLIEYVAASGDLEPLPTIDEIVDLYDDAVALVYHDYAEGVDNYSFNTYGPTAINAVMCMMNLQYAVLLDTDRRADRVGRAQQMAARIDELAWNGSFYQIDPGNLEELELYPNVAMIIVNVRLFQATGERRYLERAEQVFDGIQGLRCPDPERCPDRGGYRSPYSADEMGAETDDYTTLSATNYAMMAFGLLAEQTENEAYEDEIDSLRGFVEDYLWVPGDGRVYHHWMDGRLAIPEDPEYYCIGCNLQLLYIIHWVHEHLV